MAPQPGLGGWLGDPAAQRRSRATGASIGEALNAQPAVRAFRGDLAEADGDEARSLAAARRLMGDCGWIDAVLAAALEALAADPFVEPPFRALDHSLHRGLLLIDEGGVAVGVTVVSRDALAAHKAAGAGRTIGFSGTVTLYRVLRSGGARLDLWRCPPIGPDFDAATDPRTERYGAQALVDGGWLLIDGRREGFVVNAANADLVLLQATIAAGRAPLAVDHDAATGAFVSATATDPAASHTQMMLTLLRRLGHPDAAAHAARAARSPNFFVRWHALREWLALEPSPALAALRAMAADDAHHDLRRAAGRTLDAIEARRCRA